MQKRSKVLLGLTTAAMLIAGVAWAGSGDPDDGAAPVTRIPVEDAGTVSLTRIETGLSILAVEPEPGWRVTVEAPVGREVEARFQSDDARVEFEAELEDGQVTVGIERSSTGSSSTSSTSSTPVVAPSSTTSTSVGSTSTTSTSVGFTSTTRATTSSTSPSSTSTTEVTSPTTSTTHATTSTTVDDNDDRVAIPDGVKTFPVGSAGSVTIAISDGRLDLASVDVRAGWSYEVDKAESDDVRVEFESDSDAEAELRVRIRDGRLEVETRND